MTESAALAVGRNVNGFNVRAAGPDDASDVASLYARVASHPRRRASRGALAAAPLTQAAFEVMIQTGSAFTVAEHEERIAGAVRWHDDDGIAWFDLLVADIAGAGRTLTRAMEMGAQDRGMRLIRCQAPDDSKLPDAFQRWGYLGVARVNVEVGTERVSMLVLEKRLPLLTVREQRRADAAAIGELTGEDPWVFEQGSRPGWFVASDGDSVIGVISVRDAGAGTATITVPILRAEYRGRGIEVWMIERSATYAETNGYHTAELALTEAMDSQRRLLEDRFWQREPPLYVKRFASNRREDDEDF
ncbi:MAG: GNAT family N-acetyltransferase [Tepidiformaceae bacterium]